MVRRRETLAVTMFRRDVVAAGVDPDASMVVWVRTGGGHVVKSTETISLVPEFRTRD